MLFQKIHKLETQFGQWRQTLSLTKFLNSYNSNKTFKTFSTPQNKLCLYFSWHFDHLEQNSDFSNRIVCSGSVKADWIISICHYQYKMTSEVERFRSKMFPRNGHLTIESRNSNNFPNLRMRNLFLSKGYFPLTYSYYKKTEKG